MPPNLKNSEKPPFSAINAVFGPPKQYCFTPLQYCFGALQYCFVPLQTGGVALQTGGVPLQYCFVASQYCSAPPQTFGAPLQGGFVPRQAALAALQAASPSSSRAGWLGSRKDFTERQNPGACASDMRPMRCFLFLCLAMLGGCSVVQRVGMTVLYTKAALPETQITRDIGYMPGSTSPKHRLDLFQPASRHWPVMIFVHGGSWTSGDKAFRAGGEDVYGNIGRFYASQGIGVAVISYRLQPEVSWRQQVSDVADAVSWVKNHIGSYGGDPSRIFIAGHSAGAHLASFVALNRDVAARQGVPRIAGVICVSGAGLDMSDTETYRLGAVVSFYAKRFAGAGANPGWQRDASPATYASKGAPPFLIMYAEGESAALIRQGRHFHDILDSEGVRNRLVAVPGESHARIVLTLSRADKTAGPAILDFIRARQGGE